MPERSQGEISTLAAMPGLLVILTLGCLFVFHAGDLKDGEWRELGLEGAYAGTGGRMLREPVNRVRGQLGLVANDVVPRGGELFYLPDIEHLSGRSFLAARGKKSHVVLKRGSEGNRERDPLPAILDFDRQLRERGIKLVLLPTPSKAMFANPEGGLLRNEGFDGFVGALERNGVAVFDLAPHFAKYGERGHRLFMKTDSHWTPEAMRLGAILLTAFLERQGLLPVSSGDEMFEGTTQVIRGSGDLAQLIGGDGGGRWDESVTIHPVRCRGDRGAEPVAWSPDRDSRLLLLGDSFSNVFSLGEMGWGAGAGLAEVLSQTLGSSIDRVARNAGGALSSRQALQRDGGRLFGKKVVVWQFAARELSFGDWRKLALSDRPVRGGPLPEAGTIELEGRIKAVASVPPLARAPYRRAVMEIQLAEVRGTGAVLPEEVVLLGLAVEDRRPTAMTTLRPGQRLKVAVVPWRSVEDRYGRLRWFALDDPELELLEAVRYWIKLPGGSSGDRP